MTTREMLDDIASAIQAKLVTLSEWEETFVNDVESLTHWSEKQTAIIKRIWNRIDA